MRAPPLTAVRGSGLSSTALPSASAGATARIDRIVGTLNGAITPTTPTGSAAGHAQPRHGGAEQLAVGSRRQGRGLVALLGRGHDLEAAERADRAGLAHQPAGDLLGVGVPQVPGPAEHRGPLVVRPGRPVALGVGGDGGRLVHVGLGRPAHRRELSHPSTATRRDRARPSRRPSPSSRSCPARRCRRAVSRGPPHLDRLRCRQSFVSQPFRRPGVKAWPPCARIGPWPAQQQRCAPRWRSSEPARRG